MTRDELINTFRDSRALLDADRVVRVAMFGSYARDEATLDSDVDLLVDFGRPIGLFTPRSRATAAPRFRRSISRIIFSARAGTCAR